MLGSKITEDMVITVQNALEYVKRKSFDTGRYYPYGICDAVREYLNTHNTESMGWNDFANGDNNFKAVYASNYEDRIRTLIAFEEICRLVNSEWSKFSGNEEYPIGDNPKDAEETYRKSPSILKWDLSYDYAKLRLEYLELLIKKSKEVLL